MAFVLVQRLDKASSKLRKRMIGVFFSRRRLPVLIHFGQVKREGDLSAKRSRALSGSPPDFVIQSESWFMIIPVNKDVSLIR